jgi:hypothetical protein
MFDPSTTRLPNMVAVAIKQLNRHRPLGNGPNAMCRRCQTAWKCRPHLDAETIIQAANLSLKDHDPCCQDDSFRRRPDTSAPRPQPRRLAPRPAPRHRLPIVSPPTSVTPIGTTVIQLPRIRPTG